MQASAYTLREGGPSITITLQRTSTDHSQPLTIKLTSSDSTQVAIPSQITIPAGQLSVQFSVTAIDDAIFEPPTLVWVLAESTLPGLGSGAIQLTVLDNDSQWHNYSTPLDVDNDNTITPLDVITIINYLNSDLNPKLASAAVPTPRIYIDIDEDQFASPLDVITVINYLNRNSNGEGESISQDKCTETLRDSFPGLDEIEIWKRRIRTK
jgi:hypothetical protein